MRRGVGVLFGYLRVVWQLGGAVLEQGERPMVDAAAVENPTEGVGRFTRTSAASRCLSAKANVVSYPRVQQTPAPRPLELPCLPRPGAHRFDQLGGTGWC